MNSDGVAVWGSHGYLGSQVVRRLQPRTSVTRLGRAQFPPPVRAAVDASFPADYKSASVAKTYLRAVEERCTWSGSTGCRYVYLASMSSLPPVTSHYGRMKQAAEAIVLDHGHQLIRAGLVVSESMPGGRFEQLGRIVRKIPVVPMPTPTQFRVFVSDLDDVLASVETVVTHVAEPVFLPDHFVPGMRESSLAEVLESLLPPGKRVLHLGPGTSAVAARIASLLHVGPLDSLASIAATSQNKQPS